MKCSRKLIQKSNLLEWSERIFGVRRPREVDAVTGQWTHRLWPGTVISRPPSRGHPLTDNTWKNQTGDCLRDPVSASHVPHPHSLAKPRKPCLSVVHNHTRNILPFSIHNSENFQPKHSLTFTMCDMSVRSQSRRIVKPFWLHPLPLSNLSSRKPQDRLRIWRTSRSAEQTLDTFPQENGENTVEMRYKKIVDSANCAAVAGEAAFQWLVQ